MNNLCHPITTNSKNKLIVKYTNFLIAFIVSISLLSCNTRYTALCIGISPNDAKLEKDPEGICLTCNKNTQRKATSIIYRDYAIKVDKKDKYINLVGRKAGYKDKSKKVAIKRSYKTKEKALAKLQKDKQSRTYHIEMEGNALPKPPTPKPPPPQPIQISSSPDGASVFVNGVYKGSTNITISADDASKPIRIEKPGYEKISIDRVPKELPNWHVVLQPVQSIQFKK